MSDKPYHHGNLKNSLIEAGIELINEVGESQLSLRKAAAKCGVSHAAPYAHFQNKEQLLEEMQQYVTSQLYNRLTTVKETVMKAADGEMTPMGLCELGKAYVMFFVEHPQYYTFLFSQPCMKVDLSLTSTSEDNYLPFELFKECSIAVLSKMGLNREKMQDQMIALWAMVHGLAGIATMKYVTYDYKWEDKIMAILTNPN